MMSGEDNPRGEVSLSHDQLDWLAKRNAGPIPVTVFDALVGLAPFEEPQESQEERHELRELVTQAVEDLPEDERWLIEMLFLTRLSLRFVAKVTGIPKTSLARERDMILAKLRAQLRDHPSVREKLGFF